MVHVIPGTMEEIKQQPFYHGLLSRDDLAQMLKRDGDYLVRKTQVVADKHFEMVVSVKCAGQLRHFVLRKGPDGKYKFRNDRRFSSPLELIKRHAASGWPADKDDKSAVLRNPIGRQFWELKHSMIKSETKLGEGQFGDVHSGTLQRSPTGPRIPVAIKSSKIKNMDKALITEITKEARLVRNLEHPNVVKLHGVVVEKEPLLIVMELVPGGSLDKHLQKNKRLPIAKRVKMVLDVARGLEYIHAKGLVHRDIAARNCLYNGKTVKIGDFGLATQVKATTDEHERLPIKWLAPEVLTSRNFSPKSDVFAFGVLVWEIFTDGQQPYLGIPLTDVQKGVLAGQRLKMPAHVPEWLAKLVTLHCWTHDPKERLDMKKVVRIIERYTGLPPQPPAQSNNNQQQQSAHASKSPSYSTRTAASFTSKKR